MNNLDTMNIAADKKLTKDFEPAGNLSGYVETIFLSARLIKINNVNKKQERILVLTDKNLYNILP